MKTLTTLLTLALLGALNLSAADSHDHKPVAGPNGGRIVDLESGHAEFFVQPDRKVRVTLLTEDLKTMPPVEQAVSATAEAPAGKAKLVFVKSGDYLVSETALPEGDGYRIVLQIKTTADGKPENFRIDYHSEVCPGCKLAEYACICEGHGGAGGGHAH